MRLERFEKILILFSIILLLGMNVAQAIPTGATLSGTATSRRSVDPANSVNAYAGNITRMSARSTAITEAWQGYFGNVSGVITLADANNFTLYNWSNVDPTGEIYAANQSVDWTNIQCFNFTANGSITGTEAATRGATSLGGMNLTQLENVTGITPLDMDGVNETFADATSHDNFYSNNLQFGISECLAVNLYDSTGTSVSANYQEVLLYDPTNDIPVFTSIIERSPPLQGFNQEYNDFEMMVLENGHGTDVAATPYVFYLELS
jgi:hypothetical protein